MSKTKTPRSSRSIVVELNKRAKSFEDFAKLYDVTDRLSERLLSLNVFPKEFLGEYEAEFDAGVAEQETRMLQETK